MRNEETKEKKESQKRCLAGRRKKKIPIIAGMLLLAAVCGFSTAKVLAKVNPTAQTKVGKTNSEYLIGTAKESEIGRYQLKMTGNVSYYTTWNPPWTDLGGLLDTLGDSAPPRDEILNYYSYPAGGNKDVIYQNPLKIKNYPYGNGAKQTYTTISYSGDGVKKNTTIFDPSKIKANSSTASLDLSGGSAYKAYLLWYVRDDNNELSFANKSVDLYFDGKNRKSVTAEKACIDIREADRVTSFDAAGKEVLTTQETNSYLCMAADVTSYVKEHGTGTYGVANLPYWYQTKDTPNGGASIGAWQLVVVAEKESWDVRAVAVKMGSTFMGTGSSGEYSETVKSSLRSASKSSGQIFISGLYGNNGVNTTIKVTGNNGYEIDSNYLPAGTINGSYPVGSSATAKSSFFSALDEINDMKSGNTKYTLKVNKTTSWDTYFCLGMSVVADVPTFLPKQQTTYNAVDKTVTVTGTKTNITENSEPKIYDGRLVVKLDSNLTNATNVSFAVKNSAGTLLQSGSGTYNASDNTVTFTGINSATEGDVVSYSITCSLKSEGIMEVNNSDAFFGKVQYGAEKTGIEVPLGEVNSRADVMVHVTLDSQGAKIDGGRVTSEGTKEYYIRYRSGSFVDSGLSTPISTITIPTKKHCTFMGYYTAEDGGGTQCIDRNGTILDAGKSFIKDTILYACWSPAVFTITLDAQRSDGVLTNASSRTKAIYSKYYVGLFADANCTVRISSAVLPTSNGETCIGYWSVPGGSTMGANAAQYIESNGKLLQGAGTFDCKLITRNMTIYADWQSKSYTINCNVNTTEGIFDYGTTVFYEDYGKNFTFTRKNTDVNSMKTQTFSFNGSEGTAVGSTNKADSSGVNGSVQTFVAPYTGWYYFEVWGAQGGKGYGTAGGNGGYAAGWKRLAQGATVYVYVGGRGGNTTNVGGSNPADGGSENKGAWLGSGGYNGGKAGAGYSNWWGVGAGGGSTDIRIGGKDKDARVIAGGGGGGGASTTANAGKATTKTGGNGGSKTYYSFLTKDGKFTGKTEKRETDYEDKNELKGKYYGDGGGYPGGSSTKGTNASIKTGQGGDNYNAGVSGRPSEYASLDSCKNLTKTKKSGEKTGNGKAIIHYFNYNETPGEQTTSIYIPERKDGSAFAGYFTQPAGGEQVVASNGSIVVSNTYFNDSNTINGQATIYARWGTSDEYVIAYHANGGSGTVASQTCKKDTAYTLNANTFAPPYGQESKAVCWNTMPDGSGTSYSAGQSVTNLANPGETVVLYAQWQTSNVSYSVTLHAGIGIESVSGEGAYTAGETVTISANTKEGYHWSNWTGNFGNDAGTVLSADTQTFVFQMPEHDVDATANGEANAYTIHFDPNGGMGHIDDIVTTYDTDITLPDGAAAYKKYTLDGVNVTADVESGAISESMIFSGRTEENTEQAELFSEETEPLVETEQSIEALELPEKDAEELLSEGAESTETTETAGNGQNKEFDAVTAEEEAETEEEPEAEEEITSDEEAKRADGVADKTVYPSVFLGWAFYDDKDRLTPTWKAGDAVSNLTVENDGEITLYAVWDDCPWIEAHDLYYSLEQAQSGYITEEEILSHATATDREDGSPILPGINPAANKPEVNTSFTIPDYQASEFTNMTHDAAISENLTVTDSSGSIYRKQIMVYVVDTTPQEIKPKGQTRFINEYYYHQPYEYGGLEDNSIWKTNPEYRVSLEEAFENLKNDTPETKYYFTHETILEIKEYIREHGIENSQEQDTLQEFYERFLEPNRMNE